MLELSFVAGHPGWLSLSSRREPRVERRDEQVGPNTMRPMANCWRPRIPW